MKPLLDLRISRRFNIAPSPVDLSFPSSLKPARMWPLAALLVLPLGAASLAAQQPYSYGYAGNGQYSAPAQQYSYPQPQYQQPQYAQPQYQQPQYQQPQYQQPQQVPQPQYQQPQNQQPQGYADPQYAQPQYPEQDQQQAGADQGQPYAPPDDLAQQQPTPTQQPIGAADLEQLLAPIALYPDNLVAQILAAATYPAQVAAADQWVKGMQAQGYGSPEQIAAGANSQSGWDPSVKALTAFPQILDTLNQNLQWTTALGNAYYNQPQDVMQTVQVLRQRAQQAGNLETTPQEQVSDDQGYIDVQPADPEMVYVPSYDPWEAYGAPLAPYPGFGFYGGGSYFAGPGCRFGLGIALNAFSPFGWMGWGLNWFGHSLFYNHSPYYSHSRSVADWGFPHGGARAFGGRGLSNHPMPGYGHGYGAGNGYGNRNGYEAQRGGYQRAGNGYAGNGYAGGQRGAYGGGYTHPAMPGQQQAYNHLSQQFARPQVYGGAQQYGHPGYSYGNQNRLGVGQGYTGQPRTAYGNGYGSYRAPSSQMPTYRAPQQSYPRSYMGGGNRAYGGESFARSQPSGGFNSFGRGRESSGFSGGMPRGFSGGGGSHFSGSGGGHFSGGGGGHFSGGGGGHSSGGGHSGGGGGHRR
jgi:hypothetical protein